MIGCSSSLLALLPICRIKYPLLFKSPDLLLSSHLNPQCRPKSKRQAQSFLGCSPSISLRGFLGLHGRLHTRRNFHARAGCSHPTCFSSVVSHLSSLPFRWYPSRFDLVEADREESDQVLLRNHRKVTKLIPLE